MTSTWRSRPLAGVLAVGGLIGTAPGLAHAQYPTVPGQVVVVPTGPAVTTRTYVVPAAPVVAAPTYVVPTRQTFRAQRRYVVQRPAYVGRPALSFAPYSDRYTTGVVAAPPQPTYYRVVPR